MIMKHEIGRISWIDLTVIKHYLSIKVHRGTKRDQMQAVKCLYAFNSNGYYSMK